MKLTPYNKEDLVLTHGYGYLQEIVDKFCNGDQDCVKIEGWTHKTAGSCQSALRYAILRYNKPNVKAISRNGEVFLIKTE